MQSLGPEASWQDVCVLWDLHKHNILHFFLHFTFMHLADAFIQSDLQCIQAILFFYQYVQQNMYNSITKQWLKIEQEETGLDMIVWRHSC